MPDDAAEKLDSEAFRLLGTLAVYQDQAGWRRVNAIIIVEAGVLAGSFSGIHWLLSFCLLVAGATIIGLLYKLIERDWQVRDYFQRILDADERLKSREIVLNPPPEDREWRGRRVVTIVIAVVAFNLLLAALFGMKAAGCPWVISLLT